MPRRSIAEVLTGAVVLVVAAGFLVYAVAHSGRVTAAGDTFYARFDHVDGLATGADVRVSGVKVGSVTGATIDPKTYLAMVAFTVRAGIGLPKDTSASITSDGLLGGNYLSLAPGGDETMLKPGETITITQSAVNLQELLGKFIFSASNLAASTSKGAAQDGQPAAGHGAPAPAPQSPPSGHSP